MGTVNILVIRKGEVGFFDGWKWSKILVNCGILNFTKVTQVQEWISRPFLCSFGWNFQGMFKKVLIVGICINFGGWGRGSGSFRWLKIAKNGILCKFVTRPFWIGLLANRATMYMLVIEWHFFGLMKVFLDLWLPSNGILCIARADFSGAWCFFQELWS